MSAVSGCASRANTEAKCQSCMADDYDVVIWELAPTIGGGFFPSSCRFEEDLVFWGSFEFLLLFSFFLFFSFTIFDHSVPPNSSGRRLSTCKEEWNRRLEMGSVCRPVVTMSITHTTEGNERGGRTKSAWWCPSGTLEDRGHRLPLVEERSRRMMRMRMRVRKEEKGRESEVQVTGPTILTEHPMLRASRHCR